jgi:hypothetical protein
LQNLSSFSMLANKKMAVRDLKANLDDFTLAEKEILLTNLK